MKTTDTKNQFITMRAEGKSYSAIAETLHISKGTCTAWERELQEQITLLKQEQLDELYNSYYMTKEARIKRLGETLNRINDTLSNADLSKLSPDKLLDFKLKYTEALKEECPRTASEERITIIFSGEDKLKDESVYPEHNIRLSEK